MENKENKPKVAPQVEPKQKTLADLSVNELKVLSFDVGEQSKSLQRQQQMIYNELNAKLNPKGNK